MNLVAQPSRLRVAAASRRQHEHRARRPVNSQARTASEDAKRGRLRYILQAVHGPNACAEAKEGFP